MLFTQKTIKNLNDPKNGISVGDFVSKLIPFGVLGDSIENQIRELLLQQGFMLASQQPRHHDSAIPGGFFEIQWHDHGVPEHDDDVSSPCFFCVIPFQTRKISKSVHVSLPELEYFGADRKKRSSALECGTAIIFNPRKPHRLNYFGVDVRLIIFSVSKIKKRKLSVRLEKT